jgi:predicted RNA-binding Zn ribbon-like protein
MRVTGATAADEEFLLDLLNTSPVVEGVPRDDLEDPRAARGWMRAHGIKPSGGELAALLTARTILQAVVRSEQSAVALQGLLDSMTLKPIATADGLQWQTMLNGTPEAAVRAVLAWDALRIWGRGRLRPCANTECRRFLIDRSKPNTARWCSMAACGNRMKARRHYQRTRSANG